MNLLDPFIEQAAKNPDAPALITKKDRLSFAELDQKSNDLAWQFQKQGLGKGDIVLVFQNVSAPLYITLLALFRMGAVAMFPDPSAGLSSLKNTCGAVDVKGFAGSWKARLFKLVYPALRIIPLSLPLQSEEITDGQILENLAEDHPALITFTSGSTGTPKGIVRSHRFLLREHDMVSSMLQPKQGDVDLISLPVFVLSNLASGVTSVIPDGDLRRPGQIDPQPLLKQIKEHRVSRILAPPALCERLAEAGEFFPQLKKIFTGGGPVFPDLLQRLEAFAPQAEITAVYGSTEAEPIAHIALSEIGEEDLRAMQSGSGLLAGKPVDDIRLQIIDDEIVVTGDHVVKGYVNPIHNQTTKIKIDGEIWHKTGDAGRLDEQGQLWLLGRVEAKQGEYYPFCIETAARTMPGVKQAAFSHHKNRDALALETDKYFSQDTHRLLEQKFPDIMLATVDRIPLDKRHNSKIDYGALKKILDTKLK